MHEYTETKSIYTAKVGTYSIWEHMYITFRVENYAEQSKAKNCLKLVK